MKVCITKSSAQGYWYSANIGEVFDVYEYDDQQYRVVNSAGLIWKCDCKLVWSPEPGDMVMAPGENTTGKPVQRKFVEMVGGKYLLEVSTGNIPFTFNYTMLYMVESVSPIIDTTITFADGKTIELSEESYAKMHGEAK